MLQLVGDGGGKEIARRLIGRVPVEPGVRDVVQVDDVRVVRAAPPAVGGVVAGAEQIVVPEVSEEPTSAEMLAELVGEDDEQLAVPVHVALGAKRKAVRLVDAVLEERSHGGEEPGRVVREVLAVHVEGGVLGREDQGDVLADAVAEVETAGDAKGRPREGRAGQRGRGDPERQRLAQGLVLVLAKGRVHLVRDHRMPCDQGGRGRRNGQRRRSGIGRRIGQSRSGQGNHRAFASSGVERQYREALARRERRERCSQLPSREILRSEDLPRRTRSPRGARRDEAQGSRDGERSVSRNERRPRLHHDAGPLERERSEREHGRARAGDEGLADRFVGIEIDDLDVIGARRRNAVPVDVDLGSVHRCADARGAIDGESGRRGERLHRPAVHFRRGAIDAGRRLREPHRAGDTTSRTKEELCFGGRNVDADLHLFVGRIADGRPHANEKLRSAGVVGSDGEADALVDADVDGRAVNVAAQAAGHQDVVGVLRRVHDRAVLRDALAAQPELLGADGVPPQRDRVARSDFARVRREPLDLRRGPEP